VANLLYDIIGGARIICQYSKELKCSVTTQIKLSCKILQGYARKGPFLLQEKFLQENALNLAEDPAGKGPFLLQDLAFTFLQDGFFWEDSMDCRS